VNRRRPVASDVLSDPAATRLLERASELDAAGTALADLRAAAAEAGISSHAFDAALAELHGNEQARVPDVNTQARTRPWMWVVFTVLFVLLGIGAVAVARVVVPTDIAGAPAGPIVEEAILLRCLSPGEAAELVRPILLLPGNTIVSSPRAPRVLTIRATQEQLRNVRSVLDPYERPGSAACPVGSKPPTIP